MVQVIGRSLSGAVGPGELLVDKGGTDGFFAHSTLTCCDECLISAYVA